jgi:prepilin-type N-terminal cleavage/methylation domain-containing protein
MLKNLKKRQEGFTIIEVMIVLVIAAVILLIVFLAVPALQRNSRNTQAKNEASSMVAAAAEWSSNNNGGVPTNTAPTPADIKALANTKTMTSVKVQACGTSATCTVQTITGASPSVTQATPILVTGGKCATGTSPDPLTPVPGSTRQIALVYVIEDQSGLKGACLDSGL